MFRYYLSWGNPLILKLPERILLELLCCYRVVVLIRWCLQSCLSVCSVGVGEGVPNVTTTRDGIGQSQVTWELTSPSKKTCSNLFIWEPLSPGPVPYPCGTVLASPYPSPDLFKIWSLCSPYIYRQAGGWPSTERPSCSQSAWNQSR